MLEIRLPTSQENKLAKLEKRLEDMEKQKKELVNRLDLTEQKVAALQKKVDAIEAPLKIKGIM